MSNLTTEVMPLAWHDIDTVLLDMDGTLLDLSFDSRFWLTQVPERFQQASGLTEGAARAHFESVFSAHKGTLNWYCTRFWSAQLGFDVAALKQEVAAGIAWRADATRFLAVLQSMNKTAFIATNAHPDTVQIKDARTQVLNQVSGCYTSHDFGYAKEHPAFWVALQQAIGYDPVRTLFIDDGETILATAEAHGIGHLVHVASPESTAPARPSARYCSIDQFEEILPMGSPL